MKTKQELIKTYRELGYPDIDIFESDLDSVINDEIERRFDLLEPGYKKSIIDSGAKEGTIGYIAELYYFTYFKSKLIKK